MGRCREIDKCQERMKLYIVYKRQRLVFHCSKRRTVMKSIALWRLMFQLNPRQEGEKEYLTNKASTKWGIEWPGDAGSWAGAKNCDRSEISPCLPANELASHSRWGAGGRLDVSAVRSRGFSCLWHSELYKLHVCLVLLFFLGGLSSQVGTQSLVL